MLQCLCYGVYVVAVVMCSMNIYMVMFGWFVSMFLFVMWSVFRCVFMCICVFACSFCSVYGSFRNLYTATYI